MLPPSPRDLTLPALSDVRETRLSDLSPAGLTQHQADVYFNRYTRTNNLSVNVASIGYGYNF